ncbi:MAG: methyltransferase [Gammaproteobacteria bacterium]|nr:methyltransferase [Gammaproteobacteria bacterium]
MDSLTFALIHAYKSETWTMNFNRFFKISLLFCLIAVFNLHAAEIRIIHPGSLELVYGDLINRPPPLSSPIRKVRANGEIFYVFPDVVSPSIQSVFLLEHTKIAAGESVLDIGSGCGIQAVFAAKNKAKRVVATDLSSAAAANTAYNAAGHNLSNIIEPLQGDLFSSVNKQEKFDVIIFNIDYPWNQETQGLWKVHERFFREVKTYLNPNGRIYYQAGLVDNVAKINSMVKANGLMIMKMNMVNAFTHDREPIVFHIEHERAKVTPNP